MGVAYLARFQAVEDVGRNIQPLLCLTHTQEEERAKVWAHEQSLGISTDQCPLLMLSATFLFLIIRPPPGAWVRTVSLSKYYFVVATFVCMYVFV